MAPADFPSGIPMASFAPIPQRLADISPQNTLSCGAVAMARNIQTEKGASPYSALPSVLLLLAAGLFAKIGVAAQLIHHLH
jgi:hypothetical protein